MKKLGRFEVYPGVDNRFVICDVCGKKFRVKDTVRIVDRYNLLNNMIVCLADADQSNPQLKPIRIHEDLLLQKDYVRPEATYFSYTNFQNEDDIATAPTALTVSLEPLTGLIQLNWNGPKDYGNAQVLGYQIYRASGFSELFTIINSNTLSLATYYQDSTGNVNMTYAYQVAVVTSLGISPLSNIAYFPKKPEISFIVLSQNDLNMISLSQNNYNLIQEN